MGRGKKAEAGPEGNRQLAMSFQDNTVLEEGSESDVFEKAWKMCRAGGHRLILQVLAGGHPEGISEEAIIVANMAQAMESGVLYQHKGEWKYREG